MGEDGKDHQREAETQSGAGSDCRLCVEGEQRGDAIGVHVPMSFVGWTVNLSPSVASVSCKQLTVVPSPGELPHPAVPGLCCRRPEAWPYSTLILFSWPG